MAFLLLPVSIVPNIFSVNATAFKSALEAEIVRSALGQYLGKNDPGSVKGANRPESQ